MTGPWVVARIGDVVNHVGKPHVVDSIIVTSNGCHAVLVCEKGKARRVMATSHSTDDRWCVAALTLGEQPQKQERRLDYINARPVRFLVTNETYQRMQVMCEEREVSPDSLIHDLIWNAKEGGKCRNLDE